MKKLNSLVLSTLTAAFLVGCGSGSSDGTADTTTSTSVPVTKGPLLMATAKDSADKRGVQIDGTNKYTFEGEISYPITVTGGYVDVNNNGIVDSGDYEFTGKLSSFSNVVTPITTYLGDTSKAEGKAKLEVLKTLVGSGVSDDDLLKKDPVETNKEVLALLNTVYETYNILMDDDTSNDDVSSVQLADLSAKFDLYEIAISKSTETDLGKILVVVEQELKNNKPVTELTDLELKKINFTKKSLIGKKLVVENETYFFRENDIVLGDVGDDYTHIANYGTIENGVLKTIFTNGDYDLIEVTQSGYTFKYYLANGAEDGTADITSELTTYSQGELTTALNDVEQVTIPTDTSTFTLTTNMLNDKVLYFTDSGFTSLTFGAYDSEIKAGSFYEYTHDTGDTPIKCYGDWALDSSKANTIVIDNMCTGDINYSTMYITFTSEPKAETTVTYVDGEETGTSPIFAIENSFVAGKTLTITDIEGDVTSIFGEYGAYTETGVDYSCTGSWADLGNNKVGITCQDNGTTELPDGLIDVNSNEISVQFNSIPPKVNDTIMVEDADGSFEMTIKDIK